MQNNNEGLSEEKTALAVILAKIGLIPDGVRLRRDEIRSLLLMPFKLEVQSCVSSNVAAYACHRASRTVKVVFHNGAEWRYLAAPDNLMDDLEKSSSKGSMLAILKKLCIGIPVPAVLKGIRGEDKVKS